MRPTASHLTRAHECAYPYTLEKLPEQETGDAARFGTAFHGCMDLGLKRRASSLDVFDLAPICAEHGLNQEEMITVDVMVSALLPKLRYSDNTASEVAFAYNPQTGKARILKTTGPRDYSQATPDEFTGTADMAGSFGKQGAVMDWKTGQRRFVTPCAKNGQMRFLALCTALVYDCDEVDASLAFVDEDGMVLLDPARFDAFDLAEIRDELAALDKVLRSGTAEPNPGQHCRFCPASCVCPVTMQALAEVAPIPPPEPFRVVADVALIAGPEHAAWLLGRARMVEDALGPVMGALKAWADANGGIQSGSGVWCRKDVTTPRITLNPAATAALREILPGAVSDHTTKAAITAAAKKDKELVQKAMDALREHGAVKETTAPRYEER